MKHYMLLTVLFCFWMTKISAQEIDKSPPKWELGVDLYSIFKPAEPHLYQSTYGLVVKRMLKNDRALRFRTNFGFDFMPQPDVKGANQPRNVNLTFDLGVEKKRIYGKFVHYYGMDGIVKYIKTNSTIGFGISGADPVYTQQRGYVHGIGISAFTGGKYHITKHIAVSLETNMTLFYVKIQSENLDVDINNIPVTEVFINGRTNGIEFRILPISAVYLSYYF